MIGPAVSDLLPARAACLTGGALSVPSHIQYLLGVAQQGQRPGNLS